MSKITKIKNKTKLKENISHYRKSSPVLIKDQELTICIV